LLVAAALSRGERYAAAEHDGTISVTLTQSSQDAPLHATGLCILPRKVVDVSNVINGFLLTYLLTY